MRLGLINDFNSQRERRLILARSLELVNRYRRQGGQKFSLRELGKRLVLNIVVLLIGITAVAIFGALIGRDIAASETEQLLLAFGLLSFLAVVIISIVALLLLLWDSVGRLYFDLLSTENELYDLEKTLAIREELLEQIERRIPEAKRIIVEQKKEYAEDWV